MSEQVRWVAVYERVSSDDQRERETIKTQTEMIDRYLSMHPDLKVYKRYLDDGFGWAIAMSQRPAGRRLVEDAMAKRFTAILVTRPNRLGRNRIDRLQVYALFESLGIELIGVCEPVGDSFMYGIHSIVDDHYRRQFLAQSAEGMERAAREGRYCGGIVPLGYKVVGKKQDARLVPSDMIIWGDWTEAELVRHIYRRLAIDGWSCRKIADELNALGVPTAYQKDDREVKERGGTRKRRTQGKWRAGRIRNLVTNPIYKGELHYGRRSGKPGRGVIVAKIEGLVSEGVWNGAQEALARNRIMPKNSRRRYLLRSLIVSAVCGLRYSGSSYQGEVRYRCNGKQAGRGPGEPPCPCKSVSARELEPIVWGDIERFLRDPGDIMDELAAETSKTAAAAIAEAERSTLETALQNHSVQRDRILDLYRKELITAAELETQLDKIATEQHEIEERLRALEPTPGAESVSVNPDLLAEIRARLDTGIDDATRQEITSLLVRRIVIHTEVVEGRKGAKAIVEYRFPSVVSFSRGIREGQNYSVRRVVRL